GPYAQAAAGGSYPPAAGSGPHPPAVTSGAYPEAGTSGPYAHFTPSGVYPPVTSGAYTPVPGTDPRISNAAGHARGQGSTPTPAPARTGAAPGGGETTSGVAATSYPKPSRGPNAVLLIVGALVMAALGAVGAFMIYRPSNQTSGAAETAATATQASP